MTCPPLAVALHFFTLPPHSHTQTACVSSCPTTYIHIGLGKSRKIASQQVPPAAMGMRVVSAPPQLLLTIQSVWPAPAQTGSKRIAMMNFAHFGTRGA